MIGIIDVGGGLRDIYGAGIFDRFIDEGITFDYCIGVSAGSANVASYTAGQKGRNYEFYTEYPSHKDYMSVQNILKKGTYLDLKYVYGVLSNSGGLNPLDYEQMKKYNGEIRVVATDAVTGKPHYFDINDMSQDDYTVLMASSCLPVICPPVQIGDGVYYDGGLSDPIPFEKAFSDGCDKLVIILTKPIAPLEKSTRDLVGAMVLDKKYPNFAKAMREHNELYNRSVEQALELERDGKVVIICPDDVLGVSTLTKDKEKLDALYKKGYADAEKAFAFFENSKCEIRNSELS